MSKFNISGEWLSRYIYQSGKETEPIVSEHTVLFEGKGDMVIGRSISQGNGSVLTLHLRYDTTDHILTGFWHEKTSREGAYKGAIFHGALQLILNERNTAAKGKWVGFNSSRTEVKTGEWRLEK